MRYLSGKTAAQVLHQTRLDVEKQPQVPRGGEDGLTKPPHHKSSGAHGLSRLSADDEPLTVS